MGLEEEDTVSSDDGGSELAYNPFVITEFNVYDGDNYTHIQNDNFLVKVKFYHLEVIHDSCVEDFDTILEFEPALPFYSKVTLCNTSDPSKPIGPDNTAYYLSSYSLDNYSTHIQTPIEVVFSMRVKSDLCRIGCPSKNEPAHTQGTSETAKYTVTFLP